MFSSKSLLILAYLGLSGAVQAQNYSLKNSATVVGSCTINTTENLNFGVLNPLDPQNLSAEGGLSIDCTKGSYTVSVNGGSNIPDSRWYTSTYNIGIGNTYYYKCDRVMKIAGKTASLRYDLYRSSNDSTPVYSEFSVRQSNNPEDCAPRDFAFATVKFTQPGAQRVPVYAKIANAQSYARTLIAGNYTDTLNFTVTF